MKHESAALVFALTLGALSSCVSTNVGEKMKGPAWETVKANVASSSLTMQEFTAFLQNKKEHYPLSDEFIERYQQTDGGYIDTAKKLGLLVDKEPSLEDGTVTMESNPQTVVYNRLLCPELLLWIYEASGVSPAKVKKAKDVAEEGKVNRTRVTTIAKNMRSQVSWEDISQNVLASLEAD